MPERLADSHFYSLHWVSFLVDIGLCNYLYPFFREVCLHKNDDGCPLSKVCTT